MTLLFNKRGLGDTSNQLIPIRPINPSSGMVNVDHDTALRHSAVWACLRIRSNLISTMPLETYRSTNGLTVDLPDSPFISSPGGPDVPRHEWLQASQVDLDRCGNAFGIIKERDGLGKPLRVDLVPFTAVKIRITNHRIASISVYGEVQKQSDLWHERQFVLPGIPVGLSPVMYAAMSIGGYLSAQKFALDWFSSGAHPAGHLKNVMQDGLSQDVIQVTKERFKSAAQQRDIFVSGSDWEWSPATVDAAQTAFLDEMRYGIADVCRFFDVPGDIIGAETNSSGITYANITQRNLQLLIMHLGPAIRRRENALSAAIAGPRAIRFNTDSLLRMDPLNLTENLSKQVSSRLRTPSEARALLNLPPITEVEANEFDRLFPPKPGSGMAPAGASPIELPPIGDTA
jgi:HK97 family phage portal protein